MQTRQPPRQHNLASRKPIDYYERAGKPRPTPDLPTPKESRNLRERSGSASSSPSQVSSAQTVESDNISTTPLKSIMSVQSTKSPSILSGDMNSYNASTVETTVSHQSPPVITVDRAERDSESIVTLASSSRRTRRRSIDTNCSTAGIPPASIMERLNDE